MSRIVWVVAVSLIGMACWPTQARSDLLLRKLPADGASATFECIEQFEKGPNRTIWITIKSVGKESVEGRDCRWIELKYQSEEARKEGTGSTLKFLIPEKELTAEGNPLAHVVRAWRGGGTTEKPEKIEDVKTLLHRLHLVISPPIQDLKRTKKRETAEWSGKKLVSPIWQGSAKQTLNNQTQSIRYRLGLHDDVPFGVMMADLEIEDPQNGNGTVRYRLVEIGENAVSDFPDAK